MAYFTGSKSYYIRQGTRTDMYDYTVKLDCLNVKKIGILLLTVYTYYLKYLSLFVKDDQTQLND